MLKALNLLLLPVSLSALFSQHARAETVDKSSYNLFNPTPSDKLREMSTDRPDATEGAGTVDAGHFQLETDIFNQSRNKDKASGVKTTTTSIGSSNIRMGLTDSTELNVIFDPHVEAKSEVNGKSETVSGFGDTTLRLKLNFMGNEGGPIAIGLIPFVKIPTAKDELGNDKYEGGVILPIGLSLPEEWELGYMLQYNYLKNEANDRFHGDVVNSVTVSHGIAGGLSGYFELFSESSTEVGAEWIATVNVGLTWMVGSNFQWDAGANFGASAAADDVNPFVGFSARL